MKLLHFVSGSSVILAGWLAVTFVYHMPANRYLKLEKYPTASGSGETTGGVVSATGKKSAVMELSASR